MTTNNTQMTPEDFEAFLQSRNVDEVAKGVAETESAGARDPRFWTLTVDKAGNGQAIIRFLPEPVFSSDGKDAKASVMRQIHKFRSKQGMFIGPCPTTYRKGSPCPVCDDNTKLWETNIEANIKTARDRKRNKEWISNILVISDPANPENDGKVFLFAYGVKIHTKVTSAMTPVFPTDPVIFAFDPWKGANFKLVARTVDNQRNYDSSTFDQPSQMFNGDRTAIFNMWKSLYPLKEFVEEKYFESIEEMTKRYHLAIGHGASGSVTSASLQDGLANLNKPVYVSPVVAGSVPQGIPNASFEEDVPNFYQGDTSGDDEDLKMFQQMAAKSTGS